MFAAARLFGALGMTGIGLYGPSTAANVADNLGLTGRTAPRRGGPTLGL